MMRATGLIILMVSIQMFAQMPGLRLNVNNVVFANDATINVRAGSPLKIECSIMGSQGPADSLKLFYGANAPNEIIEFPGGDTGFIYAPPESDIGQQVSFHFSLFRNDSMLTRLQLNINVSGPSDPATGTKAGTIGRTAAVQQAAPVMVNLVGRAVPGDQVRSSRLVYLNWVPKSISQ
jgi:hypothetical protein